MSVLIDSYPTDNWDDFLNMLPGGNIKAGETFTSDGSVLTSCKFYLKQIASVTGNGYGRLYTITGTPGTDAVPNALLATSAALDVSTISTVAFTLYEFTFTTPYDSAAQDYIVTFEVEDFAGAGNIFFGMDSSSAAGSDNMCAYVSSWSAANLAWDAIFYVYGNAATVGAPMTDGVAAPSSVDGVAAPSKVDGVPA